MIEPFPKIDKKTLATAIADGIPADLQAIVAKINDNYEYWDKVKYKRLPEGVSPQMLWTYVKASRLRNSITVWQKYNITLCITTEMQRLCHEFDTQFGTFWQNGDNVGKTEKNQYLASSLMEEAIFSSKMEGASTTRVVAKDMLRKHKSPQNKSQQMIVNNYNTIQYIVEHRNAPLTQDGLLHIHRLMTENTLDGTAVGRFRNDNRVVVADVMADEVVYTPPSFKEIPEFVDTLCDMFNNDSQGFIHPVIKGVVIHFMVAYMHPFVDGNGRTARALFYWYLLKENYRLVEYLSVSRVIAKSKSSYEKTFRYSENDGNDIGYFVNYNLNALKTAFQQLTDYIERKNQSKKSSETYLRLGSINRRQAMILQRFAEEDGLVITVKDVQDMFAIASMTARKDLSELVSQGFLSEIAINKVARGYIKSDKA